MQYQALVSQHHLIESMIQTLLSLLRSSTPQPAEATRMLGILAKLIRDHLAVEDTVIYETVAATRATRHGEAAALSAEALERLKHDWLQYLDRWDEGAISADWTLFVECSSMILERVHERVSRETAILYSLAYHHAVISDRDK